MKKEFLPIFSVDWAGLLKKLIQVEGNYGILAPIHCYEKLLSWSRPEFVLGGLALSRLEVLKKHQVWADSTNWLWWDARYHERRFGSRNALAEVVS